MFEQLMGINILAPVVEKGKTERQLAKSDRETARAQGKDRFLMRKPCKHGHLGYRYVKSGTCVECQSIHAAEQAKARYVKRKEKNAQRSQVRNGGSSQERLGARNETLQHQGRSSSFV